MIKDIRNRENITCLSSPIRPAVAVGKEIGEVHEIVDKPIVRGDVNVVYPKAYRKYDIRSGDKIFRVRDGEKLTSLFSN